VSGDEDEGVERLMRRVWLIGLLWRVKTEIFQSESQLSSCEVILEPTAE
jgi:hypothetical protein